MSAIFERHRERFQQDPGDDRAFEAIEEHYFLAGEWEQLIDHYRQRLQCESAQANRNVRADIFFRLGQVWEERIGQLDKAVEFYREAVKTHGEYRPALRQLREIYLDRGQWDVGLQIAEMEAALPMRSTERASLFTTMGQVWRGQLGDDEQALCLFDRALGEVSDWGDALEGSAESLTALGHKREATDRWQRRVSQIDTRDPSEADAESGGADRARAVLSLARCCAEAGENEAAAHHYRETLKTAPDHPEALEWLAAHARRSEAWDELAELAGRRFEQASAAARAGEARPASASSPLEIALETARLYLGPASDPSRAREWLLKATQVDESDPRLLSLRTELERNQGDPAALLACLEREIENAGASADLALLLEAAALRTDSGDDEGGLRHLEPALARAPQDPRVLDALADSLARLGRHEPLADVLERRIAVSDDPAATLRLLSELGALQLYRLQDTEAARRSYERAFDLDPAADGVASALANLLEKADATDALRALFEEAGYRGPESERAGYLASLGALLADPYDEPEAAMERYREALDVDPGHTSAHLGLQTLALERGDFDVLGVAYSAEAETTEDPGRLAFLVQELVPLLEDRGQRPEALEWATRWVERAPEDRRALEMLARLQESAGLTDALLETIRRLDPLLRGEEQAANRRRIGHLQRIAGNDDQALATFRSALRVKPDDRETLQVLAELLEAAGEAHELAAILRRQVEHLPRGQRAAPMSRLANLLAETLGDLGGAVDVLSQLQTESDSPEDVHLRIEGLLERAGRFDELAERLTARADDVADRDERAQLEVRRGGLLLDHVRAYGDAAAAFRTASDLLPAGELRETAMRGLEQSLRSAGDPRALADFLADRCQELTDPENRARCAFERASLLEDELGDADAASDAYREILASRFGPAFTLRAAERLETLLERAGAWGELRQLLESQLVTHDEPGPIHERLGRLCRDRLGDGDSAIEHLEAAASAFGNRADLWRELATLHEAAGRHEDVLRVLEAELETGPAQEREIAIRSRAADVCAGALSEIERARTHYERVLELDPTSSRPTEFLIDYWERANQPSAVVRLLEGRLRFLPHDIGENGSTDAGRAALRTAVQLRIAELRSEALNDVDGAIASLEQALDEVGPEPAIARSLAALYESAGYAEDLLDLCQRAVADAAAPGERVDWYRRAGDTLRARGQHAEAAEAYRKVLSERPDDREAEAALRDVHRRGREYEPLARLLESHLARTSGQAEIDVRLELSGLYAGPLRRPTDALRELRRVLQLEPGHESALPDALELSERLALGNGALDLLEMALARPLQPKERVDLLRRRARLHVADGNAELALVDYRNALAIAPRRDDIRVELRTLHEGEGQWNAVLDCLHHEACSAPAGRRAEVFLRAADVAREHFSWDASLPWLARARDELPADRDIAARITEIHRRAGRTAALLRGIEAQAILARDASDTAAWRDFEVQRSKVLETDFSSPSRAALVLESVRSAGGADPDLLSNLDRLYAELGRTRERVAILEARIEIEEPAAQLQLHRTAAALLADPLGEWLRCAGHLWATLVDTAPGSRARADHLRSLADALLAAGDVDAWSKCAEAELRELGSAPVFDERRAQLRGDLARVYQGELSRPDTALVHLRGLVDAQSTDSPESEASATFDTAEQALIGLLREQRSWLELESRLSTRLARTGEPDGWIELARLRDEKLHAIAASSTAYQEALASDPDSLQALRGLRSTAERLGEWTQVAESLERELDHPQITAPGERAALLGRLGDICWQDLQSTTRASRCYASALEHDPRDFDSLHALQQLLESMEDWRGALELYESEVEVLGDALPERRQEALLRVADLAREHLDEPERALRATVRASEIAALPLDRQWTRAHLHRECGELEAYCEVFSAWCDAEDAPATHLDHLELARVLRERGSADAAAERVQRAIDLDADHAPSWDLSAQLSEARGDIAGAIDALEHTANGLDDHEAGARLLRACELAWDDEERAHELIRHAAERDTGSAPVQATLARSCLRRGLFAEAEVAAGRSSDLLGADVAPVGAGPGAAAEVESDLPTVRLEVALIGGRAALEQSHLESASSFFSVALAADPRHPEALAGYGEVLGALEDWSNARPPLEVLLASGIRHENRGLHLMLVGRACEAAGALDEALEHYSAAIEEAPELDEAHERRVALHEQTEQIEAGIRALEQWSEQAREPSEYGDRLMRAADWELRAGDRTASAERHLRAVLEADPSRTSAWLALAALLWELGRPDPALEVASQALASIQDDSERGPLLLVEARVLEHRGERSRAAASFAGAAEADPRCVEAALANARLLRGLGRWRAAADALSDFADRHPGDDPVGLASVLQQLGQLLAGPLEEVDRSVAVYRRALELNPDQREARETLAELLSHRPGDWDEAREHLASLLDEDPTQARLLRVVMNAAESRNQPDAAATGRRILDALGVTHSGDEHRATTPSQRLSGERRLSHPVAEKLRQMAQLASSDIAAALDASASPTLPPPDHPASEFQTAVLVAESELLAPALLPLTDDKVGEILTLIAALALDPEHVHGDGQLINALSESLGRRTRKKVRGILGHVTAEAIDSLDFAAFRLEIRALACAVALDDGAGTLRDALVALVCEMTDRAASDLPEAVDLTALVSECPLATALVRRSVRSWLTSI